MTAAVDSLTETPDRILTSRLLGFVQYVRARQFVIGSQEAIDCQTLAFKVGVTDKRMMRLALKTLLCQSAHDWERFDGLFDSFWLPVSRKQREVSSVGGRSPRHRALAQGAREQSGDFDVADPNALNGSDVQSEENKASHASASAQANTATTPFSQLDNAAELRRLEDVCERLARRIRKRLIRRQQRAKRGQSIDMRRTLRHSLSTAGVPMKLIQRRRKRQTPKLVLLLDVSRSMSVYSYFFLRFARGILGAFKQSDAFAFHTSLVHVGDSLRESSRVKLVEKMALISTGFGGGTRMDESLMAFNRDYASKLLGSKSTVVIVSDGYDTGEPEELVKQLRRIKQRSRRLLWLNPLLGQASYTPSTRSMQAALPLLDAFLPAHNLESLAALEKHLGR